MKFLLMTTITAVISINLVFAQDVTCVNLPIVQDAQIGYHDGYNTANTAYPSAETFAGYTIPAYSGTGVNMNRGLIEFDISLIPPFMTIVSASLDLYAYGPSGSLIGHEGSNNEGLLQRITDPWNMNTTTWNAQPNTSTSNEVVLPASTNSLEDYLNIDVTNLVSDLYGIGGYGILLRQQFEQTTNVLLFSSSDHPDTLKHPALEVCYQNMTESLIELPEPKELKLYPNPTTQSITIPINKNEDFQIEVYNSLGDLVLCKEYSDTFNVELDVYSWSGGIYLLKININGTVQTARFVKE